MATTSKARTHEPGPLPRRLSASVPLSLLISSAAVTISFGAIFGLLADLQKHLGFGDAWLGVITGSAFAAGFAVQMGFARYADRGRGRLMLRSGLMMCVLGCVAVACANNLWLLLVGRVVLGIGEGIFLPAARRVVILRNPTAIGAALGRLGAAQTAGFLAGPPFAAYLADATRLWVPFIVLAVALVAIMPTVFRFEVPGSATPARSGVLRTLIGTRGVRAGIWIGVGMTVSIGVYDSLWARFLKDLGASTKFVGVSLTIFGLPIVLFSGIAGRLADRFGPAKIGSIALFASAPFIVGYGFIKSYWLIGALAFAHSTFDAAVVPASQSQVARSVDDDLVAAGQGLLEGIGLLVAAASALIAAPVYGRFGARVVWTGLAGCVVVSAIGTARAHARAAAQGTQIGSPAQHVSTPQGPPHPRGVVEQ